VEQAVIPDAELTLRAFMEAFIGFFYDMMKDMMGPKRAKRYFPLIGTCALYIFFSNIMGLIPGLTPPTSTWSITLACALVVFVSFNYYGIKENGVGYFKHLAGPVWPLAPLIFVIELVSLCIRPITLSIRLMLNMAVDHLLASIITGMVMLFVPIPILMLGTLVCVVQVVVFCLLSSIYITLATEHEEHDHAHGDAHAHDKAQAAAHA
jgi:F-type H+-transporting ATPase subunit a